MTSTTGIPVAADEVVDTFATAIVQTGSVALALDALLTLWDAVDPGWAATTGGRLRLADALYRLESAGVLRLPSARGPCWDPALPRLPTKVSIPPNRRARGRILDPAMELWVPALNWAASWMRSTRPPQRLRASLVAINRWLAARTGSAPEPISREERSLEIFDDEKHLAPLTGSVLFAPGRVTLKLLACDPPLGGVRVARLAEAGPVLVLENKASFDSAWRALRNLAAVGGRTGYAALVFGGGDQASTLVPDLRALEGLVGVRPTMVDYAGDVDVAGVSAAAAFLDAAHAAGMPARPASAIWEALAAAAPVGEDLSGGVEERRNSIVAAVRLGLPDAVADRLREGVRVPQERLTRLTFAETAWWEPAPH